MLVLLASRGWAAQREASAPGPRVTISSDFRPLDVIPVKGVRPGDPPEKCSGPDDVQSRVRFLLYTNELDVEGWWLPPAPSPTSPTSRTP